MLESRPAAFVKVAPPPSGAAAVESLYFEHRPLLLYIATRRFGVPEGDAEALIQEVFVSYLLGAKRIENVRAWMVAAICNASRYYLRKSGRTESLPDTYEESADPHSHDTAERFAMQMLVHQVLGYLQPRCRETLRLHYYEGQTSRDIATELETTVRYAEKLIHKCLKRAREICNTIMSVAK